ncbi:Bromodomain containing protein [Trichomonas vaginalis G3]|uniref:Bromodomain containing protein n=1 Tax=Trichomonas vaginalis (strain ATCC PRA-98 / G3) TaxID=412133 RepID=A2F020_TRIV3|nr:acetylation-dependent protein binding [Trichomonas vaginalis G3]EAY01722.1 Bromodomain containing protein [Trichomonas vaginalis G3]KAI5532786.1 acetylation-dependent protein binding [Trichomonas vaginalis G3]|eukprot:XP_001314280.1 Bromodomain containing protein [Trichomonas vaginalis G3]
MNDYNKYWCHKILNELLKMPVSKPFRAPVDPVHDDAPDYLKKIKHPMDFSKIKQNLVLNSYKTPQEFISDVHLISKNTRTYNGKDSYFAACGDIIDEYVDEQFKDKSNSYDEEWNKNLERAISELREHIESAPKYKQLLKFSATINQ